MGQRLYEGMSLREVTDFLFLQGDPEPADLILVFGSARPEKAERAAQLYRDGHAPRLLCVGGDKRGTGKPEAEALKERLIALGLPAEAIWTEPRSLGTLENVLMAVPLVEDLIGWKHMAAVICVSSPLKTKRLKQVLARHIPRDVKIVLCPDDRQDVNRENWWISGEGRDQVFRELEKVRRYALQGEI